MGRVLNVPPRRGSLVLKLFAKFSPALKKKTTQSIWKPWTSIPAWYRKNGEGRGTPLYTPPAHSYPVPRLMEHSGAPRYVGINSNIRVGGKNQVFFLKQLPR